MPLPDDLVEFERDLEAEFEARVEAERRRAPHGQGPSPARQALTRARDVAIAGGVDSYTFRENPNLAPFFSRIAGGWRGWWAEGHWQRQLPE